MSAHKKLVAEKLAEEVSEHKTTAEIKKEKQMVGAIRSHFYSVACPLVLPSLGMGNSGVCIIRSFT